MIYTNHPILVYWLVWPRKINLKVIEVNKKIILSKEFQCLEADFLTFGWNVIGTDDFLHKFHKLYHSNISLI